MGGLRRERLSSRGVAALPCRGVAKHQELERGGHSRSPAISMHRRNAECRTGFEERSRETHIEGTAMAGGEVAPGVDGLRRVSSAR